MKICKTKKEYISLIASAAQRACKRYGYLPSVLIAQSCLENGYGVPAYWDNKQIALLMQFNNLVGIKTDLLHESWSDVGLTVWPGNSLKKDTPEVYNGKKVTINDSFRKYDNIEQSFADYLCFMTWGSYGGPGGEPKYGRKVLDIKDPVKLIKTVHQLGYATGPTYSDHVISIIREHNLTKYDDLTGVEPTEYYPAEADKKEVKTVAKTKYKSVEEVLQKVFGIKMVDNTAANRSQIPTSTINAKKYFVIHYRGVNGENPNLFRSNGSKGFGAQYDISKKGTLYRVTSDDAVTWQVGASKANGYHYIHPDARNVNCVGVECGTYTKSGRDDDDETWYFTEETQVAAAKLAAAFLTVYNLPLSHLLRHGDVTNKNCPSPLKRDQGKGSNWTWDKFKNEVSKYMEKIGGNVDGYILKQNSRGDKVTKLQEQLMLTGFAPCGVYLDPKTFVTGTYNATTVAYVKRLQKVAKIDVDGIYGPITRDAFNKYVKNANKAKFKATLAQFLAMAKKVVANDKKRGFTYGDAACLPSVSHDDKRVSCDRFVDQVLWNCGLRDVGNRSVTSLAEYLSAKGARKITSVNELEPGDIVFTNTVGPHTFILGKPGSLIPDDKSTMYWERYDCGTKERISSNQPFYEPVKDFQYAYRLSFAPEVKKVYRVQTGAFSVKANAQNKLKQTKDAGFTKAAVIDQGANVKDRYCVWIKTEYTSKSTANAMRDKIKKAGVDAIVRTIKK